MGVALTAVLRREYGRLFDELRYSIRPPDDLSDVLARGRNRYQEVAGKWHWFFVGLVHIMESGARFDRHLHNGDPLGGRTTHVPKGRPARGAPPFTWEFSARDALSGVKAIPAGDLPLLLHALEGYNGFGYRLYHPEVLSPYLWAGSSHYASGKYGADGVWSPSLVSKQIGAAVILRRYLELHPDEAAEWSGAYPLSGPFKDAWRFGMQGREVAVLQEALNRVPGIFVRVDGIAGARTSDAFRRVTGKYLEGDPRSASI